MGCKQPPTPMKTDDLAANEIMRSHCVRDRVKQNQICIFWEAGKQSMGDFYTKHHPAAHHKQTRPIHTCIPGSSPSPLQGCIEIMTEKNTNEAQPEPQWGHSLNRGGRMACAGSDGPSCAWTPISNELFTWFNRWHLSSHCLQCHQWKAGMVP